MNNDTQTAVKIGKALVDLGLSTSKINNMISAYLNLDWSDSKNLPILTNVMNDVIDYKEARSSSKILDSVKLNDSEKMETVNLLSNGWGV